MLFPVFTWIQWNVICFYLPGKAVVYLVAFHLFFVMFVWSYWMTIFTSPASPSKEVNLMLVNFSNYGIVFPVLPLLKLDYVMHLFHLHPWIARYLHCECEPPAAPLTQPPEVVSLRSVVALRFSCARIPLPCGVFLKMYFISLGYKILRDRSELGK